MPNTKTMASTLDNPGVLNPDYMPDRIVNRDEETEFLKDRVTDGEPEHMYMTGPRGSGKTLLVRDVLGGVADEVDAFFVPCTTHDTQYQVLSLLVKRVTGGEVSDGYHTAQIQDRLRDELPDSKTVVVLDDIDFLLRNDGSDLLYYLSRIDDKQLSVVCVSGKNPILSSVVDERTHSSLQPRRLYLEPYTVDDTYDILAERARAAFSDDVPFPKEGLSIIAATTCNVHLGLTWLHEAATTADDAITEDVVDKTRTRAVRRYRNLLLEDFSDHHRLLCEAIENLTDDNGTVHTGSIFEEYEALCRIRNEDSLTARRVSDFLRDLELLDIIEAEYHYGGKQGKTREVRLRQR